MRRRPVIRALFEPAGPDRFISHIGSVDGLHKLLEAVLDQPVEPHRFGDTYVDESDEAFWDLTARAGQAALLAEEATESRSILAATEISTNQLEGLVRVLNAIRLVWLTRGVNPRDPEWQLVTAVLAEATDTLLAACEP